MLCCISLRTARKRGEDGTFIPSKIEFGFWTWPLAIPDRCAMLRVGSYGNCTQKKQVLVAGKSKRSSAFCRAQSRAISALHSAVAKLNMVPSPGLRGTVGRCMRGMSEPLGKHLIEGTIERTWRTSLLKRLACHMLSASVNLKRAWGVRGTSDHQLGSSSRLAAARYLNLRCRTLDTRRSQRAERFGKEQGEVRERFSTMVAR